MLSCLALSKHSKSISSQFRIFVLTLLALSLVLFLSAGKVYSGQATLSWDPPTTNADGTPLTDLEGYKVYYGTLSGNYSQNIDAGNVTTYTANLSDGTYCFAVTAYDTSRNESDYSNEVNKTIRSVQQYTLSLNKIGTGSGTITSSPTGINCGSNCTAAYNAGTIVTLTASPDVSSTFTGWSGGGCTGTGTCSTTINANTTVTANFNTNTYAITATAGSGGSISPSGSATVNHGANQTFTITPNAGYHITDVKADGTSVGAVSAYTFSNITASHTLEASFALDTSAQEIIIDNGDPGTSYTGAWYVSSGIDPYDTDSLWSRKGTYTWTFTPQQTSVYELSMWWTYLVSRSTNIPVDIEYSGGTTRVYINQQQNGSIWNSLGTYLFAAGTSYKVTITAQGALTACADAVKFVYISGGNVPPVAYTITATAGAGGAIRPGTVTVNQGANQIFTITPDTGYHIADVKADGSSVGAVSTYTFNNVTMNHSIGATFALNTYTITATAGAGGTITPGTVTVNQGANQTFTITPKAGYHIADVKADGSSVGAVSAYTFSNVTANYTLEASFALDTSAQEIIIDNGDPGTSYTGAWYVSGGTGPYDTDSLWSRKGTYTWTFTPQQTGVYELSMWWTYLVSRSTNIPVDIEYSGGTTRVYINQDQNGSIWNSLGTYLFAAGTSYKITITAQGSLTTCADAVKFVQKLYNY